MDNLEGTVERVTYFNPENGYSIVRLKPARNGDLVTLVGNLPELTPGEHVRLQGQWTSHAEYGRQFKVERCEQTLPATVEGIRRYLGSGLIKGVGPRTAERIVQTFGAETLNVIDLQPDRLREVPDEHPIDSRADNGCPRRQPPEPDKPPDLRQQRPCLQPLYLESFHQEIQLSINLPPEPTAPDRASSRLSCNPSERSAEHA